MLLVTLCQFQTPNELKTGRTYLVNEERLTYYLALKSRQFRSHKIISKNAHVNVIYLSCKDSLYIVWRGLLFIIVRKAVESLNAVIAIVPTLLLFCNSQYGNIGYNTGKQNRKSIYLLISVQLLVVFPTLIQNLFTNAIYWEYRGTTIFN